MLKGISPLLSPSLLAILASMGHGDEIVLADSNFPGAALAERIERADGLAIVPLLEAILPLFPLDTYDDPLIMMAVVPGDPLDPAVEREFLAVAARFEPATTPGVAIRLERHAFYERARKAFAIVMTGECRPYANLILKKGCVRVL